LLLAGEQPELVSVLKAEVDDAGVDLVMMFHSITRHIQMKTLAKRTTNNAYAIAESLSDLPGGCVLWMCYERESMTRPDII